MRKKSIPPKVSPRRAMRRYVKNQKSHLPGSSAGYSQESEDIFEQEDRDEILEAESARAASGFPKFAMLLGAVNAVQSGVEGDVIPSGNAFSARI